MGPVRRVVLFSKVPRLGAVKTRLSVRIAPAEALTIYCAFLADQLSLLDTLSAEPGVHVELCLDRPWTPVEARLDARISRFAFALQGPGDLGQRLDRAIARGLGEGARSVVVIGADCPTLPISHLHRAQRILDGPAEVVLGPAEDGGYVLIGLSLRAPALFAGIPWGTSEVLSATRRKIAEAGLAAEELEPWYDIDTPADLARLHSELSSAAVAARAPETARVLGCRPDGTGL